MRELIIIGAGGMGRSLFNVAIECTGYDKQYVIKGFIDDNMKALDGFENYPPILGTINGYEVQENDLFICSMGGILMKKKTCQTILEKGGHFTTLIHPLARINANARIGVGSIIAPFAHVGADTIIGDFVLIQSYCVIGHDVKIGNWSRVDTHSVCVGGTVLGNEVVIHTGAIINHKVVIGDEACVGAGSFVIRKVKSGVTVYGNPARKL